MTKKGKVKFNENEQQMKEVKDFLRRWLVYHKVYKRAFKGEEITKEGETEFLKMKADLSRRHAVLVESLGEHYISSQSIRPILFQTVTLRQMSSIRQEHYDSIERSWHETYIHLNETVGHLTFVLEMGGR
jgi:hypothetical protein